MLVAISQVLTALTGFKNLTQHRAIPTLRQFFRITFASFPWNSVRSKLLKPVKTYRHISIK